MAKSYFAERGLTFEDMDVSSDREALNQMVAFTGQYGVPVLMVGDEAMVGWDKAEFERLLAD